MRRADCRISTRVNLRRIAHGEGDGGSWAYVRPPPKTRRAVLFRRAIVDLRSVRHARGDLGTLLAFASHPPLLAATWRARCGGWPGFARRVPKTPRRPQIVAHPRHLRKYDQSAP